ncbi:MAG: hypothetical protein Q4C54_06245 [Clostridia bacterium]|nr:hypothetical protein [Clostridia bacterium]
MAKKNEKLTPVHKPYIKGSVLDNTSPFAIGKLFVTCVVQVVLYLALSMLVLSDNLVLRYVMSIITLLMTYGMYFNSGMQAGTQAVTWAENMYARQERGSVVSAGEATRGYHPLKGFVHALLGMLPVIVVTLLLAFTAQKQSTGIGALPSWVSGYNGTDAARGLAFYAAPAVMKLEDILRVIVRVCIMPVVALVGTGDAAAVLTMERLSPLVVLVPAVMYGIGYTRGVDIRGMVHADIEQGNRKRARQQKKKQKQRRNADTPEQLN